MNSTQVRRTFNINNFESLTLEGNGADDSPTKAHILAHIDCLKKAQLDMIRIFNVRSDHGLANEYDSRAYSIVTEEINRLTNELITLNT